MKIKRFSKAMACILSACMILSSFTVAASAASDYQSETHDVFKHTESTLAPGIEQSINYAYAKDGKQMVYYVATADVNRDDVVVQTSYLKQHENGVMGMEKLTNQIAYANEKYSNPDDDKFISEYYNVVAGVNASFYNMTTGQPMGITYIDGVSFGTSNYDNFFAILNDGKTAVIDYAKNLGNYVDAEGNSTIWQAAGGSQWLVRDGVDVTASATGSYNTDRHSRTCVGVTAEGKVVMMVLDGRQEPFSCGGSMHELAQIMLEQGCVAAINLDGGGSTTYAARQAGTDSVQVINRPSDGSERSISSGLIIASTAAPSNVFDTAVLTADSNYVTPGSTVNVSAVGVSPAGTSAEIPADVSWQLADSSLGTVAGGVFTSNGTTGDAVVQMVYNGNVVGETTIHVVLPDKISFEQSEITVPYGKSVGLDIKATYGLNEVTLKNGDIEFALSDTSVGSIEGFTFTAGDGSVITSTVTATVSGTEVKATAIINLGKGSEVLYDFEDGDVSDFDLGYIPYNYVLPEGKVYSVTSETGKVHSGNGAMALDINYGNSTESGFMMTALEYKGEEKNYANATKLGMWMYIPDEDVSAWIRYTVWPLTVNDNGEYVRASAAITNTMCDDLSSTTGVVNTFEEPGWHYLSIDLSNYKGLSMIDSYIVQFYISDRDGASYDYYYNEHKSYNGRYVFYVDDITVDYSSAVDDREAPVFSNAYYASTNMSDATVLNGQTVTDNILSFSAKVAENTNKSNYTGLDLSTAKAYVDGVETPCEIKSGTMSIADKELADGLHHIKFSICDKAGNYASIIRDVNVQANSGKSTIKVVAHDSTLDKIKLGSLWYADIVATDIEKVNSVEIDIDLNNMSKWELDHMDVAKGFEAKYSIQDDENIATIKINRVGKNDATGEGVLVSMPIRTWELKMGYTYTSGTKNGNTAFTYAQFKSMQEFWPVDISMEVDRGIVTFNDDNTDTFSGETPQVDTESYKMAKDMISTAEGLAYYNSWDGGHIHTAEAIADKAATCTEAGYTGRTFCEVCNSVVDWGTTVPATGHTYEAIDGVLKCKDCGELFNGEKDGKLYTDGVPANGWVEESYYVDGEKLTGIKEVDGYYYDFGDDGISKGKYTGLFSDGNDLYYIALGNKKSGWINVDENDYYFDGDTFKAVDGVQTIDNHKYTFVNNILMEGSLEHTSSNYLRLYWAGKTYYNAWLDAQGKKYHFDAYGHLAQGLCVLSVSTGGDKYAFVFNQETGVLERQITGDGLIHDETGTVYLKDDIAQYAGLVKEGSDYYYINSYCTAVTGKYWVSKTNDLLPGGYYQFDNDGRMINPPEKKNGIYVEDDGTHYYVDGKKIYAGLVKDGDDYYYFNSSLVAVTGEYWVFKTNDLLPGGNYKFDDSGKMLQGVVTEDDGTYYYVDGRRNYAGLVKDGENYYYFNSSLKAVTGKYWVNKTNGLLDAGYYNFDSNGKMIRVDENKNGIYFEDDGTFYYVNGVRTYAGLVKDGEDYYYFNSSLAAVTGEYWVSKTNDLLPGGNYKFDNSGKMLQGVVTEEDGIYYYANGRKSYAGLVKDGEDYYYFNSSLKAVTGKYWVSKTNGLLDAGYYTFDNNGKLI